MTQHRLPHAVLDLPSRRHKALKIERLLGLRAGDSPIRMLEIGCGSGGISHYFATHPSLRCEVQAVDVHDSRLVMGGYAFALVEGVALPFADESFDVVISNHVVEHVGPACAQREHLRELHRIMAPGGIAYLAVPNRWMLVEPHYHLAFLSWLPRSWRSAWLRLWRRGEYYDCEPLSLPVLECLLREGALDFRNRGIEALRATFEIERAGRASTRLLARVPDALLRPFVAAIPTHIYTFRHGR